MQSRTDNRWERRQKAHLKRRELRRRAVAYKGGKCSICPYAGSPNAFDFHHPDPREKDFNISDRTAWTPALVAELDKCVLLCCRCHREVHDGLHPGFLVLEDSDRGRDGYDEFDPTDFDLEE